MCMEASMTLYVVRMCELICVSLLRVDEWDPSRREQGASYVVY